MKRGDVLLWGFAGTTVLTTILRLGQAAGLTRIDLPLILGLIFTPDRDRAKAYGFLVHFVNGWIFAGIYAAAFRSLRRASWWIGGTIGLIHGLFVLTAGLPALPGVHPRMASENQGPEPTSELEPPGFMAINYGRETAIATLVAHVIFGVILGAFLSVPASSKSRWRHSPLAHR
ncbi:MAG TPA: hypothetical protein VFI42_20495 [Thermomicrobiaceae bacterium]|nr:hypothetical protein [Thermomicrobiaceae bacterium]